MFEKMVVSSTSRSERRIARYLAGTFLLYSLALATALALSVALADPRIAIAASAIKLVAPSPGPRPGGPAPSRPSQPQSHPNSLHFEPLPLLMQHQPDRPPLIGPPRFVALDTDQRGNGSWGNALGQGQGTGPGSGDGSSDRTEIASTALEPPAKPPKPPEPPRDRTPVRISGQVLQGKAIERKIPEYPALARTIHLEGQVVVEVVISPDGRVESAHAVSGHPLLVKAATDAAWGWRFQPTMLGDVPVRVTGVLTFVFKF